ncbi:hypothetical protein AWENTII_012538 [Aspergillus wentii]|nr:hypothetical protein MW887_002665 [Aspergillus wentii]
MSGLSQDPARTTICSDEGSITWEHLEDIQDYKSAPKDRRRTPSDEDNFEFGDGEIPRSYHVENVPGPASTAQNSRNASRTVTPTIIVIPPSDETESPREDTRR